MCVQPALRWGARQEWCGGCALFLILVGPFLRHLFECSCPQCVHVGAGRSAVTRVTTARPGVLRVKCESGTVWSWGRALLSSSLGCV